MVITSVERNRKNKNMLSVYVDNQYAFSIPEDDYIRLNLYEKQDITEEDIIHIKENVYFNAAKAAAVKFLSLRLRSESEVRKKLERDAYDSETIDKVVNHLKSLGYLNDRLYVQKYLFDRSKLKPKSKKMLKYELLNKGIAEEEIDEALSDWKIDDSLIAENLAKRKFGKYDLADEKIVKKIYSFLLHRGFSHGIISEVIKKMQERPDK